MREAVRGAEARGADHATAESYTQDRIGFANRLTVSVFDFIG
jgi:hypothetical protein